MTDVQDGFKDFWMALENTIDEGVKRELVRTKLQEHLWDVWNKDTRPTLHRVRDEMDENADQLQPSLENVALTGRPLDMKLGEFFAARDRWGAEKDRRTLRSVLGWAKIILGSLLQGLKEIPGLSALIDVIKEFIEAFDQAVADAE